MTRLKLFLFYTAMAWASLLNPKHGKVMVDAAERGATKGGIQWASGDTYERAAPPAEPENEVSVGLALFGALAALSTLGWCAILVMTAFGWSQ